MQDQLKIIREFFDSISVPYEALSAFEQIEAMAGGQEPVHWRAVLDPEQVPQQLKATMHVVGFRKKKAAEGFVAEQIDFYGWRYTIEPLYAAPVAQQSQAEPRKADVARTCPFCNEEWVEQPQARPDFTDEWAGYLKDGETPFERFLRERKDVQSVLKLYQRALEENERLKAQQPQADTPQATTIAEAARDVGKWLNERPNRPIDLRHVAMLVAHAMQPQAEAVPTIYVSRGQLENLKPDPEDEAGTYLPVRKTPKGKFTYPLFTAPQQPQPEAVPNVYASFITESAYVIGTTKAPIKRVQWEEDGTLHVYIDHWPQQAGRVSHQKTKQRSNHD